MQVIARASAEDAEPILALQRRAYESEARLYNDWRIPALMQTLGSLTHEISTITVLKALRGTRIVGSVRGEMTRNLCCVGRLIVEPSLQRQGIGTALLEAIEEVFDEAQGFELFTGILSEGNIRLYHRHGYAVTHTEQSKGAVPLVFMRKSAAGCLRKRAQSRSMSH